MMYENPVPRHQFRLGATRPCDGSPEIPELARQFERAYSVETADRTDCRRQAFRLRWQVYCRERPYEDPSSGQAGIETDEYDSHARHCLLAHRSSGQKVGTARLILPVGGSLDASLPMLKLRSAGPTPVPLPVPVESSAEISRFCISKSLRAAASARGNAQAIGLEPSERPAALPPRFACLGLVRGLVRLSVEEGVTHWLILAERSLLRLLAGFGLHFEIFGPAIMHRGKRYPCFARLSDLLNGVLNERSDVWRLITKNGRFLPAAAAGESEPVSEARVDPSRLCPPAVIPASVPALGLTVT